MCVYAVCMTGETLELEDLTLLLKEQGVARYRLPERLEIVEIIPRNPVGKLLKSELRLDIRNKMEALKSSSL